MTHDRSLIKNDTGTIYPIFGKSLTDIFWCTEPRRDSKRERSTKSWKIPVSAWFVFLHVSRRWRIHFCSSFEKLSLSVLPLRRRYHCWRRWKIICPHTNLKQICCPVHYLFNGIGKIWKKFMVMTFICCGICFLGSKKSLLFQNWENSNQCFWF